MKFQNFDIWRGRLPHWRADNVTYYVTFRHKRDLTDGEKRILFRMLVKPDGQKWDLLILCVLHHQTELIFRVKDSPSGRPYELSTIVEKAKTRAGKEILKKSGERFPPFYAESYDRIIRDPAELEDRWLDLLEKPSSCGYDTDIEEYDCLFVADAPA